MLTSTAAGLVTGLGLIVAIGAQNAYVIRQGLTRSHVGAIVLVCLLSDVVLIGAGVAGIGTLVEQAEWLVTLVRWLGVAFLLWYAVTSLRSALHPGSLCATTGPGAGSRRAAVGKAVALTWLNPHVYLDTVLFLGSLATSHGSDRWWFAAGACVASAVWFVSLGYGARGLAPVLARPAAWRVLDLLIGVTMLVVAFSLATG